MESIIKIVTGSFLSLALLALTFIMLLNSAEDATKQAQQNTHDTLSSTAPSSSAISNIDATIDIAKSTLESQNKEENRESSGMSSFEMTVLILIIPAMLSVFLVTSRNSS